MEHPAGESPAELRSQISSIVAQFHEATEHLELADPMIDRQATAALAALQPLRHPTFWLIDEDRAGSQLPQLRGRSRVHRLFTDAEADISHRLMMHRLHVAHVDADRQRAADLARIDELGADISRMQRRVAELRDSYRAAARNGPERLHAQRAGLQASLDLAAAQLAEHFLKEKCGLTAEGWGRELELDNARIRLTAQLRDTESQLERMNDPRVA